jgi:RNA-binding protein NOB1
MESSNTINNDNTSNQFIRIAPNNNMEQQQQQIFDIVLDANAFLGSGSESLLTLCTKARYVYSLSNVLQEIRDVHARQRLASLPFEIKLATPSPESVKRVIEFARKTGDASVLSKTDILVIALTQTLNSHIVANLDNDIQNSTTVTNKSTTNTRPIIKAKPIDPNMSWAAMLGGAHSQQPATTTSITTSTNDGEEINEQQNDHEENDEQQSNNNEEEENEELDDVDNDDDDDDDEPLPNIDNQQDWPGLPPKSTTIPAPALLWPQQPTSTHSSTIPTTTQQKSNPITTITTNTQPLPQPKPTTTAATNLNNNFTTKVRDSHILALNALPITSTSVNDDNDDDSTWAKPGGSSIGWGAPKPPIITTTTTAIKPTPSAATKKSTNNNNLVFCITSDFAMQNVLLRMLLPLMTPDGRRVTQIKNWVWKCDTCSKISAMDPDRKFCPSCGKPTLGRLAYSINSKGKISYHYSKTWRPQSRGVRYSIGKNDNLLLREDQLLSGKWGQIAKQKKNTISMFGQDVNEMLNVSSLSNNDVKVGYGSVNPNAKKGRERRGAPKKRS